MRCRGNHNGYSSLLAILALCSLLAGACIASVSFASPSRVRPSAQERQALMSSRAVGEDNSQMVRLIRSDESGMEIEIFNREYHSSEEEVEGQLYHHLSLEGAALSLEEGKPQLPVRTITLGIPPEVDVAVDVVETQTERSFEYRVYPVPRRVVSELTSGEIFTAEEFYRDENLYSQNIFYPPRVARIIQTAFIRDQRVAQCEVCPFQFNPASGELIFHRRLVLRVTFVGDSQGDHIGFEEPAFTMATKSPFESVLENVLLNYASAKRWRLPRTTGPKLMSLETETPYDDPTAYRITLTEDGMYSMSWGYLQSQGVDVSSLDPRTVKMYSKGHQIPIYVHGARDGRFDPGDYILFWGEAHHGEDHYNSPYTDTNVYWLAFGGSIGLRMVEQDGSPVVEDMDSLISPECHRGTYRREVDGSFVRLSQVSDESIDRWLWEELSAGDSVVYNFWVEGVADSGQCEIEVRLRGETFPFQKPNHHTQISFNGIRLEDEQWSGQSEHIYHKANLPNSYIWEGKNVLKIKNVGDTPAGDVDKIYLNWFRIDYWRGHLAEDDYLEFGLSEIGELGLYQFSVSGFTGSDIELFDLAGKKIVNFEVSQDSLFYTLKFQDRLVRPTQYVALTKSKLKVPTGIYPNEASNLHDVVNGADYLIIVHSDFYESVLPLATHRESEGLRVKVVLVQDIYDEFNDGLLSPQAIRNFLHYAYENWQQPAPSYVLLVGDTSYGNDKRITHAASWRQKCFVPTMMAWTSAWGVSASDNRLVCLVGKDKLPDMAIGRFPVSTKAEADLLVDKVLQYELNPEIGPWRRRIQLLAGEGEIFELFCVQADSSYIPPCYQAPRIYTSAQTDPTGSRSIHYGSTQDLIRQWDDGVVLATFTGHGGGSVWFDANFFLLEHVPLLNNPRRMPVVFSLTCFVGYFDNPWHSSLGEEILRAEGKGAVAHFGSSGVAWAYQDNLLGYNMFQAIFQDKERTIGMITTQGKLGQYHIMNELVDVFNLLGDPAMKLALPKNELSLELSDNSLPLGEAISIQGHIPESPNGMALVAFCDNDSSGWSADTVSLGGVDKVYAARVPVVQESISVATGQFSLDILPPDTLEEHPFYEPLWGKKSVTAYFWNQETDAIGWAPFALDAPYLVNIRHHPELPTVGEEVYVYADVYLNEDLDPDGPDSVICSWGLRNTMIDQELGMSTEGGVTYSTDGSIVAPIGTYVYYRIKVMYGGVGGSPSTDSISSGIRWYQVHQLPNLQVTRRNIFLFVEDDQLRVGCWVRNKGVANMDSVLVRFYDDRPDSNHPIGDDRIAVVPANDSALAQVYWEAPGEPHELWVWVDPDRELDESLTFDNQTHRSFSNVFLGTPQHGTTVRGSNAQVSHTERNAACQISSGALSQSALLYIDNLPPDSACYDPAALYQPGLSMATLQDGSHDPYGFVFDQGSPTVNSATIAFWYDPQDSLTQLAIQEDNLKICYLSEEIGKWFLPSDQELLVDSAMVRSSVNHLGVFGLFLLDDQEPPKVQITVEGQPFVNGDYISANPIISAVIEDENGIDIHNYPLEVTLNGSPVASSQYSIAYSPETSNLCLLTYMPQLSTGSDTLAVRAYDCFGNSAADTIFFNVTGGFEIPFLANHPNPFQTETVIAFVVASDSPAERVTIRIYTVRGRLVRELQSQNVGPGYVEVVWDGHDSQGERVANGVYYYKMTVVKGDGEKISPMVRKMAKLE
jgi:hypothetical protein